MPDQRQVSCGQSTKNIHRQMRPVQVRVRLWSVAAFHYAISKDKKKVKQAKVRQFDLGG